MLYSLNHHPTCRFEVRQALLYQLVSGLTDENGKYNYAMSVHFYPPFFDIFCSAKNYKIALALTGAKAVGVKRIRIHDLRHSHISLLIDMGFSAVAIADRVGHESIEITYRYAHLFPSKQTEMADKLNMERSI